jgi:hypothetical protein
MTIEIDLPVVVSKKSLAWKNRKGWVDMLMASGYVAVRSTARRDSPDKTLFFVESDNLQLVDE